MFAAGLAIQLLAFLGDHVDDVPWVSRAISPGTDAVESGLEKLASSFALTPTDKGFKEISRILLDRVSKEEKQFKNGPLNIKDFFVEYIRTGALRVDNAGQRLDVVYKLSTKLPITITGGQFLCTVGEIKAEAERLKGMRVFWICCAVFLIGSGLEVWAFSLESRDSGESAHTTPNATAG